MTPDQRFTRKLYALLGEQSLTEYFALLRDNDQQQWWHSNREVIEAIASSSDHINFQAKQNSSEVHRHPISGQEQAIATHTHLNQILEELPENVRTLDNPQTLFWWLWRFLPEMQAQRNPQALLDPQHPILPDCPKHSYRSTVSALAGAIAGETPENLNKPYLLLFTFSPVQEFIKASRKFLDFWSGSYMLHYLSAKLCWFIAQEYGPDAVITPSLWGQEIIDALMVKELDQDLFTQGFHHYCDQTPEERFENSPSLSTAGFPNTITALIPEAEVESFGAKLVEQLKQEWQEIADQVRHDIRSKTIEYLQDPKNKEEINNLVRAGSPIFSSSHQDISEPAPTEAEGITDSSNNPNDRDINKLKDPACWTWRKLWEAQINHTWEPYWAAIPLGDPDLDRQFAITSEINQSFDKSWKDAQEKIAPSRYDQPTPTQAEDLAYRELNIGTWWANTQSRIGQAIQAVKNTRTWRIPAAPGERSTLSGQFTAVHPFYRYDHQYKLKYNEYRDYREGGGLSSGSMQLFWELMALVYPGLFNGSEKLNALELTKRMAWSRGGVTEALGIEINGDETDYESLICFPNLSSIAAASFAFQYPARIGQYWGRLRRLIDDSLELSREEHDRFCSKTCRPFQVPKVDAVMSQPYNGVAFSSKWLADDMGLNEQSSKEKVALLRKLVDQAHKGCGFSDGSPADWWVIIAADGDGMGKYVSGRKLKNYQDYIEQSQIADETKNIEHFAEHFPGFLGTRKRMGPATHVGLNRALLDFSNRIVPYLTEQRFCGRVVYSGGDDVLAVLPLTDLPEYLLSLRAAWCGDEDPYSELDTKVRFHNHGGYWQPEFKLGDRCGLRDRPLFTMGEGATLSAGIIIAHKSVPLPTVLESLWEAEAERAKKLQGVGDYPDKDGCCFRVIYGGGNTLEALIKGQLLPNWWQWLNAGRDAANLSPVLYRLAEELPRHADLTQDLQLISKAAKVIINSRDNPLAEETQDQICDWFDAWECWAFAVQERWKSQGKQEPPPLGITMDDLAKILRFSAFWLDKMAQGDRWSRSEEK